MAKYEAIVGVSYTPIGGKTEVYVEAGSLVEKISAKDAKALLEMGAISKTGDDE